MARSKEWRADDFGTAANSLAFAGDRALALFANYIGSSHGPLVRSYAMPFDLKGVQEVQEMQKSIVNLHVGRIGAEDETWMA